MHREDKVQAYPLVYGNISYPIPNKRNEKYSNWIVYVRGHHFEDLSFLVKKVVFHLHESFEKRVREISAPPFEVKEAGWGSFDVLIQVVLRTGTILDFKHHLRLHHLHTPVQPKKPQISEYLDEVVFLNPTPEERAMLARAARSPPEERAEDESEAEEDISEFRTYLQFAKYLNRFDAKEEEQRLQDSLNFINHEIRQLKERALHLDSEIQKGYEELSV